MVAPVKDLHIQKVGRRETACIKSALNDLRKLVPHKIWHEFRVTESCGFVELLRTKGKGRIIKGVWLNKHLNEIQQWRKREYFFSLKVQHLNKSTFQQRQTSSATRGEKASSLVFSSICFMMSRILLRISAFGDFLP